jgi:hypothetical protein
MAGDRICNGDEVLPARLTSGISGAGAMAKLGNAEAVGSFMTRAGCFRMAVGVCVLSRILALHIATRGMVILGAPTKFFQLVLLSRACWSAFALPLRKSTVFTTRLQKHAC